jgi:hypothetical protein
MSLSVCPPPVVGTHDGAAEAGRAVQSGVVAFRSTLNPRLHLQRMLASPTPVVVVVGDSTSTLSPMNLVADNVLYYKLILRLRQDNPTKTFTFHNHAISGTAWAVFSAVPTNHYPAWYFNTALPWLAYIRALNADTIFINFGVNDAECLLAAMLRSALATIAGFGTAAPGWAPDTTYPVNTIITDDSGKLQICSTGGRSGASRPAWATEYGGTTPDGDGPLAWQNLSVVANIPKVPDIVLITNKNNNAFASAPYNSALNQNGTIASAAYQRTLALCNAAGLGVAGLPPIGLIDIGRQFTMAYNGYDPVSPVFSALTVATSPIRDIKDFPYVLPPAPSGSFEMRITMGAGSSYTGPQTLVITLGSPGGAPGNHVQFQPTGQAGKVIIGYANAASPIQTFVAPGVWRAWNNVLTVTAHDDHLMLQLNGKVVLDALVPRFILPGFRPTISFVNPPANPSMILHCYNVGTFRATSPTIPDAETCYGGVNAVPNRGGNGINHNSSFAISAVDNLLLDNTQFGP